MTMLTTAALPLDAPIKLGVSGHQNLGGHEEIAWVLTTLTAVICRFNTQMGLTCLAAGTDQLFALALLNNKIPYTVVIPCQGYETTFGGPSELNTYQQLLKNSTAITRLPHSTPSEDAYWDAGKYIVSHSDHLVVVWDGQPARGLGGTGDVVDYAVLHKKNVIHINHQIRSIEELTPCQS